MPHGITCEKVMDALAEQYKRGRVISRGGAGILLEILRCLGLQGFSLCKCGNSGDVTREVDSLHSPKH